MALNTINPNHNCFITFDIKKEELCISVAEIYINVFDPKDAFINNLILVKVSLKKSYLFFMSTKKTCLWDPTNQKIKTVGANTETNS
jgi:hypothetical protein